MKKSVQVFLWIGHLVTFLDLMKTSDTHRNVRYIKCFGKHLVLSETK